ncbi:PTS cellobiose transporter subunit IIA [Lactobacillus sp. LL6]|uniref:PTS cellobiose transporter subunit IIA n=1 Tax=Lactobacillus sp. LL6 TaxID=2596827 RepID=UPI001185C858|nr:PTS cellobiose transporter subunit IIA [Lactobacillus sp. LL6]TSO26226.1 PTS cellobiose transporter subunit IIA [Lactobacillus sp. LL6]
MKKKMSVKEQNIINAKKAHKDSIKYLYFGRYLMVRYCTTALLFANLFWLIFCFPYHNNALLGIILALIMTIYAAGVAIEQLSKMHNRKPDIPITRVYLLVQIFVNFILGISVLTPLRKYLLPFITDASSTWVIEGILLIGVLLCIICEVRINNIIDGKDKYLRVINTFKKNN